MHQRAFIYVNLVKYSCRRSLGLYLSQKCARLINHFDCSSCIPSSTMHSTNAITAADWGQIGSPVCFFITCFIFIQININFERCDNLFLRNPLEIRRKTDSLWIVSDEVILLQNKFIFFTTMYHVKYFLN